jgi:hypothetical protein
VAGGGVVAFTVAGWNPPRPACFNPGCGRAGGVAGGATDPAARDVPRPA